MTKDLVIIVLGIWVAVLPFLGFPNSWDRIILIVSGFSISLLMFLLRRDFFSYVERLRKRKEPKHHTDSFVESEVSDPMPQKAPERRRPVVTPVVEPHHVEEPQQS